MKRCIAAVALATLATSAVADTYPSHVITMVIPYAAGGPSDTFGRILAEGMSRKLGQRVIVENVSGAGGVIAGARIVKAQPDGYQVLLGNIGTNALVSTLFTNPPYDPATDLEPVILLSRDTRVLLVNPNFPAKTFPEFVEYVKKNAKTMSFGSGGIGSTAHAGCLLMDSVLGVEVTHVPYRGAGPAMQDLIGGRIDFMCDALVSTISNIQGGMLRPIIIIGDKRSPLLPGVPTAKELGMPQLDVTGWQSFSVPKGTPQHIIEVLNKAASEALDSPEVRERLESLGENPTPPDQRSPEYFREFSRKETERWRGPIQASGVKLN
jgi:tripartite-type tricarboxylate transporter receptor subunit TctC